MDDKLFRVYISGPMADMDDLNRPAFDLTETTLREWGLAPVNPFVVSAEAGLGDDASVRDYAKSDLVALADCDGIAMLRGWRKSRGATAEYHVARWLRIPVWEQWSDDVFERYLLSDEPLDPRVQHLRAFASRTRDDENA